MLQFLALRLPLYLKVAPFPHATTIKVTLLSLFSGVQAKSVLMENAWENAPVGVMLAVLSAAFLWGAVLCQADALSRFREYKRILLIFRRYGFQPRTLRLVSGSRCQRDAAMQAARETGYAASAKGYFYSLGYRWYHIIPDAIVSNPLAFFSPSFLKSTFLPRKDVSRTDEDVSLEKRP
ncbi:MAG: hypothetical protein ACNI27_13840 [Desulfovibrio sp.]